MCGVVPSGDEVGSSFFLGALSRPPELKGPKLNRFTAGSKLSRKPNVKPKAHRTRGPIESLAEELRAERGREPDGRQRRIFGHRM
jgi:hypothetical protein